MNNHQDNNKSKDNNFLRTVLISVICIPIIAWLLYSAYEKNQRSATETAACQDACTKQGYNGYDFKWPIFSGPQCACLGTRQ